MSDGLTRRGLLSLAAAAGLWSPRPVRAATPFRFGLTPVFLDNDAEVIARLRAALSEGMFRLIEMVQRRTYQEVTGLLLEGGVDAAWLCGFPYLQHEDAFALLLKSRIAASRACGPWMDPTACRSPYFWTNARTSFWASSKDFSFWKVLLAIPSVLA